MPFCSQCGNRVGEHDVFCSSCGAPQGKPGAQSAPPPPPPPPNTGYIPPQRPGSDPLAGLNARTASILCYVPVFGWIASIVVLAADKFRRDRVVRFHAFQGLYLFVAWLMNDWVLRPVFRNVSGGLNGLYHLIQAALLVMSIFMMVKASRGEDYHLPVLGELAQRSAED